MCKNSLPQRTADFHLQKHHYHILNSRESLLPAEGLPSTTRETADSLALQWIMLSWRVYWDPRSQPQALGLQGRARTKNTHWERRRSLSSTPSSTLKVKPQVVWRGPTKFQLRGWDHNSLPITPASTSSQDSQMWPLLTDSSPYILLASETSGWVQEEGKKAWYFSKKST